MWIFAVPGNFPVFGQNPPIPLGGGGGGGRRKKGERIQN